MMDHHTNQWTQVGSGAAERKVVRPQKDEALNCPRCQSTNTKFCYYNNYSLTQPRYLCKSCRRYWTEGGTLRNVPVGGGSRKNKIRSSSHKIIIPHHPNPSQQDLNLIGNFPSLQEHQYPHKFFGLPKSSSTAPFAELLRIRALMGAAPPDPNNHDRVPYSSTSGGLSFHDLKPAAAHVGYSADGRHGISGTSSSGISRTFMFPLMGGANTEQLSAATISTATAHHHNYPNGIWNGMLGGGPRSPS